MKRLLILSGILTIAFIWAYAIRIREMHLQSRAMLPKTRAVSPPMALSAPASGGLRVPADMAGRDARTESKIQKPVTRIQPHFSPPPATLPASLPGPVASASAPMTASSSVQMSEQQARSVSLPLLDEKALLRAVVKIECPSRDMRGKYVGSGFVMPRGVVATAAHLIEDSGSDTCRVIFPKDRAPAYYLFGATENREAVKKRHDEQGIDIAFIFLPALAGYPDARAIFPDAYPFIPYPPCSDPAILGDTTLHFGYPASFQDQSYLAEKQGTLVSYADIGSIREALSEDQTYGYKTPEFLYTQGQSQFHPYAVSRVSTFYGDSGGLAFDATRQCILGPSRGGTSGGGVGENFTLFALLSWPGAPAITPP